MVGGEVYTNTVAEVDEDLSRQSQHKSILPLPSNTHYRAFRGSERDIVERCVQTLQVSGFYWGPLPMKEAHDKLKEEPMGTFLVRDSSQGNHLFSLSVKTETGPFSLRVNFKDRAFWLENHSSDCLVRLLEICVEKTRTTPLCCNEGIRVSFSKPLRRSRIPDLQELCRKRIVTECGIERVKALPIQPALRKYIEKFPFKI
ncbi:suppressor of cytokine signaling 1-like [Protopterus annectens]|uniref:suppressor of cytokine signaling 1-like n=1 Tax=Protopterus annectens TaxID=7888 RepID=UPI001CFBBEC6|nr:suppressor of cytokine signaling 1-like [Protopterus annectens]XP_043930473.1 suppressor of cytokine signaling 1-like [Protopterus annectens]